MAFVIYPIWTHTETKIQDWNLERMRKLPRAGPADAVQRRSRASRRHRVRTQPVWRPAAADLPHVYGMAIRRGRMEYGTRPHKSIMDRLVLLYSGEKGGSIRLAYVTT